MATLKSIPLSQIHIGERLRPIDEEFAQVLAVNMAEVGLMKPITVRATPAANGGKTPWTLVAGGHRYRGAEINEWEEIEALVVEAGPIDAQLMEVSENIYSNTLTKLDRAVFVLKFREMWEEKHGKIDRTRNLKVGQTSPKANDWPSGKQGNDCPVFFAPGKELSERLQERLGFGKSTLKYVTAIGQKLHPALRTALRGTPVEDDQKQLLKLASMPEAEQAGIAAALKFEPDLKVVLAMDKPKPIAADPQEVIVTKVAALLERADLSTLDRIAALLADAREKFDFEEAA
ncbi:hypothetical protein AKG11_28320 [Shinella sp. SUS2]|uniref:ParB N-terminal domain-containing protein n=1 Tax=unclassified Shinella TaxID=2643062 RepID=UPI00068239C5|nr:MULTISPECIES: ParB N-terminal domain-containing protein [unclassified Shinella]KNY13641.1 hypothetical protein AKG11_28320 [Shinella sp. SUS2]KOC72534.1 hypothetical protein AKG10_27185 [Shinella sp. GWS1]